MFLWSIWNPIAKQQIRLLVTFLLARYWAVVLWLTKRVSDQLFNTCWCLACAEPDSAGTALCTDQLFEPVVSEREQNQSGLLASIISFK